MGLVALIHPAASFCPGFTVTIVTLGILITDLYLDRDPAVVRKVLLGYIIFLITAFLIAAICWLPAIYLKNTGKVA